MFSLLQFTTRIQTVHWTRLSLCRCVVTGCINNDVIIIPSGPGALEALVNGCPFIQPKYKPPRGKSNEVGT